MSQAKNTKPLSIQRAVICLWMSAGLVALLTVASWVELQEIPSGVVPTLTNLVTLALLALVALKVGAGRNWAPDRRAAKHFAHGHTRAQKRVFLQLR